MHRCRTLSMSSPDPFSRDDSWQESQPLREAMLKKRPRAIHNKSNSQEKLNKMPAIVWKGYVSFGLISFPVRLFSAARPESVHFHMDYAQNGPAERLSRPVGALVIE